MSKSKGVNPSLSNGVNPNKPHLRFVPGKGHQIQITLPPELIEGVSALAGKPKPVKQITEYIRDKTLPPPTRDHNGKPMYSAAALRAAAPIEAKFILWIEEARQALIRPRPIFKFGGQPDLLSAPFMRLWHDDATANFDGPILVRDDMTNEEARAALAEMGVVLPARMLDGTTPQPKTAPSAPPRFDTSNPAAIDVTPVRKRCPLEPVLDAWEAERALTRQVRPDQKKRARNAKNAVFKQLFAWGKNHGIADATDLASYIDDDFIEYRRELVQRGGTIAFDQFSHFKAIYKIARQEKLLTTANPLAEVPQPGRLINKEPPFSREDAGEILLAARASENPGVKWGIWLAPFTGGNNSEIFEAMADEFYRVKTGELAWDCRGRILKSGTRGRIIPIHSSLIREGFSEYLDTRKGKRLFEDSCKANSEACNKLIHQFVTDQTFKSFRKNFTHPITKAAGDTFGRYLSGHAARDIHERYYMFAELPDEFPDLVAAINKLDDPTL